MPHASKLAIRTVCLLAFAAMSLPLAAVADPPPWAPAHGWRKHQEQGQQEHGKNKKKDKDNDDDREVAAQHNHHIAQGACDRQLVAGASSTSTNNLISNLLGTAAGGMLGTQTSPSSAQTTLGAIAGLMVGGGVGRTMAPADQGCVGQTLEHASTNQTVAWKNPDNGLQYRVTPSRTFQTQGGGYCRDYTTSAVIDGRWNNVENTSCRQADGSWRAVN